MTRFEPAGDTFLAASHAISRRESAADRGEAMPDYITTYPVDADLIFLPYLSDYKPSKNHFKAIVEDRRTNRRYDTNDRLSLQQLSWLLW
ncbi:MAG: hypothetical protein GX853_05180, partial [Chloroflexi bacterium]|nr:hypothetical protein [Chloroflexota bacterium]